jgi:site-specific DNA-cytosine methylase
MKFRFVELCAGIGGLRLGLEKSGWESVAAVELDKHAAAVHKLAFGDCQERDVLSLCATDLPSHSLLAAGFPCQPFSSSGHRTGFQHRSGTVFEGILELLKENPAKALLLENVKGLLTNERGYTMARVLKGLTDAGYHVTWAVINASWFGVPQNRPRVVIFARHTTLHHELTRDLFGAPNYEELFTGSPIFEALERELGVGVQTHNGGSLSEEIERLEPRIGKPISKGSFPFGSAGVAMGDHYASALLTDPGFSGGAVLGSIVCPNFWKRDEVRSARYWGHSGKTRAYLNDGEVAHCIGTTIGASPLFGIREEFIRTRKDELALLEFANWSRSDDGIRVFRLAPERGLLLFGRDLKPIADALSLHKVPQTKLYQLVGNMVVPEVASFCGRVMRDLLESFAPKDAPSAGRSRAKRGSIPARLEA